jgi:hypothetical protein
LAFFTIEPTPGLGRADRRRAHRVGPEAVAVSSSYQSLLGSAGFEDVHVLDGTRQYWQTQKACIDAVERRAEALRGLLGAATYDERLGQRQQTLAATDAGLLARFMYSASRR